MRTKVEITGINTSELTVIPSEQVMELIRRSQEGDYEARDELVHGNIKLVLSVIKNLTTAGKMSTICFRSAPWVC